MAEPYNTEWPEEFSQIREHLATHDILRTNPYLCSEPTTPIHSNLEQNRLTAQPQDSKPPITSEPQSTPPPSHWPPIPTSRLLLRELHPSDTTAMHTLESHPENARYQSWHPWSYADAQRAVSSGAQRQHETERVEVELAVVHEGEFVGRVGGCVRDFEGGMAGEKRCVDVWYSFLPSAQGKGLATEAVRAFLLALKARYAGHGGLYAEIECDPRNVASAGVARRLGFVQTSFTERAWECKGEWVGSEVWRRVV